MERWHVLLIVGLDVTMDYFFGRQVIVSVLAGILLSCFLFFSLVGRVVAKHMAELNESIISKPPLNLTYPMEPTLIGTGQPLEISTSSWINREISRCLAVSHRTTYPHVGGVG